MNQCLEIKSLNLQIFHDLSPNMFIYTDKKKVSEEVKLVSPLHSSTILLKHTDIQLCKSFPDYNCFYIYNRKKGSYKRLSKNDLKTCLISLLGTVAYGEFYNLINLTDHKYIENVFKNLSHNPIIYNSKTPVFDRGYLVMENGLLNLKNKILESWTPEVFIPSSLPYPYIPDSKAPIYMEYLDHLCEGMEDRKEYLKAMFYSTLLGKIELQVFFYVYGYAGSGKSTLGKLFSYLIGEEGTYSTTLKALNTDQFETFKLIGKKLIIINDTEKYSQDLSILKAYVGGDSLRGRVMFSQENSVITGEGMILIIGNDPLNSRDTSNAIYRRLRPFKAEKVAGVKANLIEKYQGVYYGELVSESSGIINWILSSSDSHLQKYIVNYQENVPSFTDVFKETKYLISPMSRWVEEETMSGYGSFVGFKSLNPIDLRQEHLRRALYPAYDKWCERNGYIPIKHVSFTETLLKTCPNARKDRKSNGIFIKGIVLQPKIYEVDYQRGSNMSLEDTDIHDYIESKDGKYKTLEKTLRLQKEGANPDLHPRLSHSLYSDYKNKLQGNSDLKRYLNRECSLLDSSLIETVFNEITLSLSQSHKSIEFCESLRKVLTRGFRNIVKNGICLHKYQSMGVSPRILPVKYGTVFNSVKASLREKILFSLTPKAKEKGYCIVDFDLKSCYTSILLGLYPHELRVLQYAIQKVGLWKYLENEFIKRGKGDVFHKKAVKICTYSALFGGGNKAMIDGISEHFQKENGLTPSQFRACPEFEEYSQIARNVTYEMQNSSIVSEFRGISDHVKKSYMDDFLIGPTGHRYRVDQTSFNSCFANYLQSYEFAILSQSTLDLMEKYPNIELLSHLHDGNLMAIPIDYADKIIQDFQSIVSLLGKDLGLKFEQSIEVKTLYK